VATGKSIALAATLRLVSHPDADPQETEAVRLVVEGQTSQEIAQELCVSVNTVKTHLKNIYGKLGVSNCREATAQAKKPGLVA
jgi:LuxR family maltose regulon positive regulatory protein